jgi:hypothetical protein
MAEEVFSRGASRERSVEVRLASATFAANRFPTFTFPGYSTAMSNCFGWSRVGGGPTSAPMILHPPQQAA